MIQIVSFSECGFNQRECWATGKDLHGVRAEAVQLACDYLMDTVYPEFSENEVIPSYADITIDWVACTVLVPVNQVYKPEYLH